MAVLTNKGAQTSQHNQNKIVLDKTEHGHHDSVGPCKFLRISVSSKANGHNCIPPNSWDEIHVLSILQDLTRTACTEVMKLKWDHDADSFVFLQPEIQTQSKTRRTYMQGKERKDSSWKPYLQSMKRGLTRDPTCWSFDLGLFSLELWENKFLLFKLPMLYFVITDLENEYTCKQEEIQSQIHDVSKYSNQGTKNILRGKGEISLKKGKEMFSL